MERVLDLYCGFLKGVIALCLAVMVVLVFGNVVLRYGFMESPNIPRALEDLGNHGLQYNPMQASFFLGREVLVRAMVPKLTAWRLFLFLFMARNAVPATEFFRIPSDRVVELGVRVAI